MSAAVTIELQPASSCAAKTDGYGQGKPACTLGELRTAIPVVFLPWNHAQVRQSRSPNELLMPGRPPNEMIA